MKFYISYFGQMRNFTDNMLPVSTAKWDAKWFKGIARIDDLVMPDSFVWELEQKDVMCRKNCPLHAPCDFMMKYKEYLNTLDFDKILAKLILLTLHNPFIDTIVLMVYEKADIQCAERPVLQQWFKEHGIELNEWTKPTIKIEQSLF